MLLARCFLVSWGYCSQVLRDANNRRARITTLLPTPHSLLPFFIALSSFYVFHSDDGVKDEYDHAEDYHAKGC
jgi:hypothetical protein